MIVFIKGFLIGLANIIPGVSGGTLALILGIYKRLISALHNVGMPLIHSLLAVICFKKGAMSGLKKELQAIDFGFLALIGVGAITAILATSKLMENMLDNYHAQSYAFFFGLVLVSIIFPYRYLKRKSWKEIVSFIVAAVLTVSLTFMVSEDKQIAKAKAKQEVHNTDNAAAQTGDNGIVSLEHPGLKRLSFVFLAAALAISAMVLPGISGSFVLLLMGVYFDVLHAISHRQIIVLAVFALGLGVGLLVFSRIMNYLLEKLYNVTMAFMIGLMVGSLYVLWPFKKMVVVGPEKVYLGNIMPDTFGRVEFSSLLMTIIGMAIILGFYFYSRKRGFDESV